MKHSFQCALAAMFMQLELDAEAASTIQFSANSYIVAENAGTVDGGDGQEYHAHLWVRRYGRASQGLPFLPVRG